MRFHILVTFGAILLVYPEHSSAVSTSTIETAALNYADGTLEHLRASWKPLEVTRKILDLLGAKNQKEANEEHLRKLDKHLDVIQSQLSKLVKQIGEDFKNIPNLNRLLKLIDNQNSQIEQLQTIVQANAKNPQFDQQLESFIKFYKADNYEREMASLISNGSLVSEFIQAAKNQSLAIKSSPQRLLFDFHMAVLYHIFRGYYFIESCVATRDIVKKHLHESDYEHFRVKTEEAVKQIVVSMRKTQSAFGNSVDNRKSYLTNVNTNGSYQWCEFKKLYLGISQAPTRHVITGVRFRLHNESTLFVQIQTGQLIDNGQINATTVQWREPSADIGANVANLYCEKLTHSNVPPKFFKKAVLTGIQLGLSSPFNSTTFTVYGHKVKDYRRGILDTRVIKLNSLASEPVEAGKFGLFFVNSSIELQVKAPLCGLELSAYKPDKDRKYFMPRLITFDTGDLISNNNLIENIKKPMSAFAKNEIKKLIHQEKSQHLTLEIGMGVAALFVLIAIVVIVVVRRRTRTRAYDEL